MTFGSYKPHFLFRNLDVKIYDADLKPTPGVLVSQLSVRRRARRLGLIVSVIGPEERISIVWSDWDR